MELAVLSLDERPPIVEHAALRAHYALAAALTDERDPDELAMARATEADDLAAARARLTERDAVESVEAEESRWHHPTAGVFALSRRDIPHVIYERGPG